MENLDTRIPFFEPRFIKPLWALRREQQGCTVEDIEEFHISTERPAPPLRDQSPVRLGVGRGFQYLGHWNKYGFIIVPSATAIGEVSTGSRHLGPVARRGMISEHDVYYPVRNVDYRTWQINHKQGGDLILYSDRIEVRLVKPIFVEFDL
ncbi:DUF6402 family protein [Cupriavidus sp. 2MCAB6]|uniref:DUF6402 family protein n=1 Tax=Cupriavidus sp. 2MCAB6 TaxID=3232981 RepID=UPI003F8E21DB